VVSSSPWLDMQRRPKRRHLLQLDRSQRPVAASADPIGRLVQQLQQRWAERIDLPVEQVLLCRSAEEALRLVCGAVLIPDDQVFLARPSPTSWPAAILGTGATFIDVGRVVSGRPDPAVIKAVGPARLVIAGAPALTGAADHHAWSDRDDLLLIDACLSAHLCGKPTPGAELTLAALRDPHDQGNEVLWALLGPAAAALRYLMGPSLLPAAWARRALSCLTVIDRQAQQDFEERLQARADELEDKVALSPGQSWMPMAGVQRAVSCLAADGQQLLAEFNRLGASAEAHGPFPGRGLVHVSLL